MAIKKCEVKMTSQRLIAINDRGEQCGIPLYENTGFALADTFVFCNWLRDNLKSTEPEAVTLSPTTSDNLLEIAIKEAFQKITRSAMKNEVIATCDIPQTAQWFERAGKVFDSMVKRGLIERAGMYDRIGQHYRLKQES